MYKLISRKSKEIFKSREIKNGIWLYILQFFNSVVPLITLPYITRILGRENYGVFSFSLNIIGYLTVIVEYGFDFSGTRKVVLAAERKEIEKTFISILIAKVCLCVLCFLGLNIFFQFYHMENIEKLSCYILFLSVFGTALQQTWLFRGLEKMYYITIISVTWRIISLALIFQFVNVKEDILLYCILYSITPLLIGVFGVIIAFRMLNRISLENIFTNVLSELKSGWYIFTTSLSSKVFSAIGVTILGIVSTKENVGVYSALQKIPTALLLMWIPVSQVLYPFASRKLKENFQQGLIAIHKVEKVVITICIIVTGSICLYSQKIVSLVFGYEYAEYYYLLIPLLVWMNIGIWNNFLGIQTLLAGGYDKEYSKCFQISVLTTVILNILLINQFELIGAAIAPMLSECILFVLLKHTVRKIRKA